MLNKVILVGRLTNTPELRKTNAGTSVASFTLAVDNALANADGTRGTCFMNVVVFNTPAENCSKFLGKGSLVAIDGKLNQRKFVDASGNNRNVHEVVADAVKFLDRKQDTKSIPSEDVARDSLDEAFEEADSVDDDLPF